jgi:restriction endonuclease S subunit
MSKSIQKTKLDIGNWKEYRLGDLFEIKGSKTTAKQKLIDSGIGSYPYITTKAVNNGVDGFFSIYTENGNCLTVDSAVLGTCFYQEKNFSASDHVEILKPLYDKFNKNHGFFIKTCLDKINKDKYNYGIKYNQTRISNTIIKLPSIFNPETNQYEPDWQFMDDYISSLGKELNKSEKNE